MNLSEQTVSILKNFSTINQNLLVKQGKVLNTMSAMKNIVAKAEVEEEFPVEFAIYDLNEFLSCLSLFSTPELTFKKGFVVMSEGKLKGTKLKYWFSDPSVVTSPTRELTMPLPVVSFLFESSVLSEVTKAAAVIGAPDMVLEGFDASAVLKVTDKKNTTANSYDSQIKLTGLLGTSTDPKEKIPFKFWFKVENLKLLSGDYDVDISEKRISHFQHKKLPIEYFIALEPESSYGA